MPVHARDDLRRDPSRVKSGSTRALDTPTDRILDLQQSWGNAAVARLVQRAPKDRPASTDAPGYKKPPKKGPDRSKMPDIKSRVIGVSIEQGMTKIAIGVGPDQGVEEGMAGYLAKPDGKPYKDFEIHDIRGAASYAYVDAIVDEVRANSNVVITPSKGGSPRVEDQQF